MRLRIILVTALLAPPVAAQDVARGKLLYLQCRACHTLAKAEPHKVGPNLHGILGRPAATAPGFKYSRALAASKLRWTDADLDRWLTAPGQMVRGTTMAFAGIARPADRAAVIAYLKSATE